LRVLTSPNPRGWEDGGCQPLCEEHLILLRQWGLREGERGGGGGRKKDLHLSIAWGFKPDHIVTKKTTALFSHVVKKADEGKR